MKTKLTFVAVIALGLFPSVFANAAPRNDSCSGKLRILQGIYMIADAPEKICFLDEIGQISVPAVCATGFPCKITGKIDLCAAPNNDGRCYLATHIISVQGDGHVPARLTGPGSEYDMTH